LGSGWISGFAMVAVAMLFPERHLARVFASTAGIWGIATVLGPLVGGLFAQAGNWRAVFWLFAAQALLFTLAAPWLLGGMAKQQHAPGIPWRQLGVLGAGIAAIAIGDVTRSALLAVILVLAGLAILALVLRIDHRSKVRLLPHRAGDLRTIVGSGYASLVALTASSMALTVYGPAILQQLRGIGPIAAGYVVAAEAVLWTISAIIIVRVEDERGQRRAIRAGALCVLAGVAGQALVMRAAPLAPVITAAAVMGCGFGLSNSFSSRRVLAALADDDRAIGAAALMTVRQIGGAVGAAIAGAVANLVGFSAGLSDTTAHAAGLWVFAASVPLALIGAAAAWRFTGSARASQLGASASPPGALS
jgi:MFS family permease